MTAHTVKINDDGSINLWEQDNSGWRDAIELTPKPKVASNQIAIPQYNLSTNPVEITYVIVDISANERKGSEITIANRRCISQLTTIIHDWVYSTNQLNLTLFEQAKLELDAKINAINAATTHEELDAVLGL